MNRWSNKAELENRKFFFHAHNIDSGDMRMRMTSSGYGIKKLFRNKYRIKKTKECLFMCVFFYAKLKINRGRVFFFKITKVLSALVIYYRILFRYYL